MTTAGHHHAGAFIGARKHRADHHRLGTCGDGFGYITGLADAAICNDGDSGRAGSLGTFDHRCQLRNARTSHHARNANRARPNPHFYCIHACIDQALRAVGRGDISADNLRRRKMLADIFDHINFEI